MPADTLTREQIVRAAIDLLDAEGLEGLNMRSLGKRLGSAATAVYWHVGSKRELITLAADHVFGEITLPDLTSAPWRTAAASMATDFRAMLTRHPWLVQIFGSYVVYGPGRARHDDHTLAVYEAAGFTGVEAGHASATVLTFVLGNALGAAGAAASRRQVLRAGGDGEALERESLAKRREAMLHHPRLRAHLETAADSPRAAPEERFHFGLEAVLDGLEAQLLRQQQLDRTGALGSKLRSQQRVGDATYRAGRRTAD